MVSAQYLAVDQGTHATRALVFDAQGRVIASTRQAVALHALGDDRVEQDGAEILASLRTVVDTVLAAPGVDAGRVHAAGLACQRSSVVAWNRVSGAALGPVLSWQDRRNAPLIDALAPRASDVAERTGLRLSPHYGASKLRWLLEHIPAVAQAQENGELLLGPLVSWLLFHWLEGRPALVDHANAARTLLWNLRTRDWDPDLLQLFGVARDLLPECRPVCADYGIETAQGIPVRAVNGDQTAALYALGPPAADTLTVNLGTGAFVLLPVAQLDRVPDGLLAGIARSNARQADYYLEGTVNGAGAALDWAAAQLAVANVERQLPQWLAEVADPPLFLNSVAGLGAPWWQAGPEPHFADPPRSAAHGMVAVAESILFLVQANIERLQEHTENIRVIRLSGGLARLDGLCQKLADLSGYSVLRPGEVEATARGIAWLAAGGSPGWEPAGPVACFAPRDNPALQARYRRFITLLTGALS
jgi:glycerol kinase